MEIPEDEKWKIVSKVPEQDRKGEPRAENMGKRMKYGLGPKSPAKKGAGGFGKPIRPAR